MDVDEFVNDWQLRNNNRTNYRLIRTYAENCGKAFDWMIEVLDEDEKEQIHMMLEHPSEHMPETLNGIHAYPGTAIMPVQVQNSMIKKTHAFIEKNGGKILFGTKAVKLLTESADLIEQGTNWLGHGWNGDGLRLGMLAGGRMEPRSHAALGGNYSLPGFEVIGSAAVLRVNKYGKRYSNEGFGTHILAATIGAKQPNGMLYGVFDSDILDQLTYQTNCHAVFDYCNPKRVEKLEYDLKRARTAGKKGVPISVIKGSEKPGMPRILYAADTLEQLAEYMYEEQDSRETFLKTVGRYNQLCKNGKDVDYGKEKALLHGVLKAPFYAVGQLKDSHHPIGQSFKLLVTVSGLLIDENQQVLNEEYEPIPGLFATGNSSGCRFSLQYSTSVAGQSISMAHTLGREVGSYVASLN